MRGEKRLLRILEVHVPYFYIILPMVEMGAAVGLLREIKRGSHTRKEQLVTKTVASCMDEGLLVTDMYLLATWANMIQGQKTMRDQL